jgi:hypothetical protein
MPLSTASERAQGVWLSTGRKLRPQSQSETGVMKAESGKPVEQLFVLRARITIVGREALVRGKEPVHFVVITNVYLKTEKVLTEFSPLPIVQRYGSRLEQFFGLRTKVLGFAKSVGAVHPTRK